MLIKNVNYVILRINSCAKIFRFGYITLSVVQIIHKVMSCNNSRPWICNIRDIYSDWSNDMQNAKEAQRLFDDNVKMIEIIKLFLAIIKNISTFGYLKELFYGFNCTFDILMHV